MFNEDLETDPHLQPDAIQQAMKANAYADALLRVTDSLDATLESMTINSPGRLTLARTDIADLLNMAEQDVDALDEGQKQADLRDYLPLHKRDSMNAGEQKAFRFLRKNFRGNLTETMWSTVDLFRERFSADELTDLGKAIRCLDLGLFLDLLCTGIERA